MLDTGDMIALVSLLLTGGISAYIALFMRQANRRKIEAEGADVITEASERIVKTTTVLLDDVNSHRFQEAHALITQIEQLTDRVSALETALQTEREARACDRQEVDRTRAELDKTRQDLADTRAELRQEREARKVDRAELDETKRSLKDTRRELERTIEELAATNLALRSAENESAKLREELVQYGGNVAG